MEETRKCRQCNEIKEITKFRYDKRDNCYRRVCKHCINKQRRINRNKLEKEAKKNTKTELNKEEVNKTLAEALLLLTNYNYDKVNAYEKEDFVRLTKIKERFSFSDVKQESMQKLRELGLLSVDSLEFDEDGNYIVIGDTFGQHTKTKMFDLIKNVCMEDDIDAVFVVGNNLDHNNSLSESFKGFPCKVIFVSKSNELEVLHGLVAKMNKEEGRDNLTVVKSFVKVGDVVIKNQERIQPYVRTALSSIDPILFPGKTIVNLTRHEFHKGISTKETGLHWIASPGVMCEPFVLETIKQIDFTNGLKVKRAYKKSFVVYRKRDEDKEYWEQGFIHLKIKNKISFPTLLRVFKKDKEYYTLDCNKVVSSSGLCDYKVKTEVLLSDIHAPYHDKQALDLVLQAVEKLKSEKLHLLGDVFDMKSFNPHEQGVNKTCFHTEFNDYEEMLKKISSKIDKEKVNLYKGNHEDFLDRWLKQNPFLSKFLSDCFEKMEEKYCNETLEVKEYTTIFKNTVNKVVVHHGDAIMWGLTGNNLEKSAKVFGDSFVFIGHSHSPAIRFGTYRMGCICNLDQGYNEKNFSSWEHGFGLISYCKELGIASPQLVNVVEINNNKAVYIKGLKKILGG